jgi:hypothetical protein
LLLEAARSVPNFERLHGDSDMETLEVMGKVAGIGGLALGTFLILFRDVIRKSIFSNLSRDQSYRLIRLILILVWSIAIAGIAAWLIAPMIARTDQAEKKVVVTMDSPLLVYDTENNGTGRTNTDEIVNALKDVGGLSLYQVSTNLEWNREEEVRSKNPDLIVLHLSAFAGETGAHNPVHAGQRKLLSFFNYMADTPCQFLVYTRDIFLEEVEDQQAWVQQIERRTPGLKGRIHFFNFVPGKPKVFRDAEVQRELKMQVRNILGIH